MICESPILAHYDPNKPTKVSADASRHALGCVLMQYDLNHWKPVAYASRALTTTEQKYAQIELELLAIYFACHKFDQYLLGKRFLVESDHKPLITLFGKDLFSCPLRAQRLMLSLQRFDFDIEFVPGKFLYTADVLSRFVDNAPQCLNEIDVETEPSYLSGMHTQMKSELSETTLHDPLLMKLSDYITRGWPKYLADCDIDLKLYWPMRNELSIQSGIIFRGNRVVIPHPLRQKFLSELHDGHLGQNKCKTKARELMYWPGMSTDIDKLINACDICNKFSSQQQREPLLPHPVPKYPYERVGLDLFTCDGKDYLIITDYYSSFPEVFLMHRTTSAALINTLKPNFSRYGYPVTLVSDGAPNLTSEEFDNFLKNHCIMHVNSSAYFAQSNGMVEKAVQTCKKLIIKASENNSDIFKSLHAYRTSPLACGLSPAQLFFGRRLRGKLPIAAPLLETSSSNFARNFEKEREVYKKYYDRGTKPLKPLHINDRVRIFDSTSKTWGDVGHVMQYDGPRSYIVKTDNGSLFKRNRVHLKPVVVFTPSYNVPSENKYSDNVQNTECTPNVPLTHVSTHSEPLRVNSPDQALSVPCARNHSKRVTRKPNKYNDYIIENP